VGGEGAQPPPVKPAPSAEQRARELFQQGRRLHARGERKAAERALEEAARLVPTYPDPHLVLGLIYAGSGRRDEALRAFTRFLALAPVDPRRAMVERRIQQLK